MTQEALKLALDFVETVYLKVWLLVRLLNVATVRKNFLEVVAMAVEEGIVEVAIAEVEYNFVEQVLKEHDYQQLDMQDSCLIASLIVLF
jgi:hypothetical protein